MAKKKPNILIVTSDKSEADNATQSLKSYFKVNLAQTIKAAWEVLYEYSISVVLVDTAISDEFLLQVKSKYPNIVRLISVDIDHLHAMFNKINQFGVYQMITKPWQIDDLKLVFANSQKIFELQQTEDLRLLDYCVNTDINDNKGVNNKQNLKDKKPKNKNQQIDQTHCNFDKIIRHRSNSPLNHLCKKIKKFSEFEIPILITGESGTGKELFAQAIHHNSQRHGKPLLIMNCAAMPDDLLESELFGHKKGAFTGAYESKIGLLEAANGGMVFLDEIGDISPAFQVKLLRVLQDNIIRRLGENKNRKIDVRFIAATNKDLLQEVKLGNFREDLFFRISAVSFTIPPLKERGDDVLEIINYIIKKSNKLFNTNIKSVDDDAMNILLNYDWPGNIRELENELQQAIIISMDEKITINELSEKIKGEVLCV